MFRIRSIVGLTLLISIIVLIVTGSVAYRSVATLSHATGVLIHTKDVLLALEQTMSVLRDAESGQRGFLITGEEEYLEPYTVAMGEIDAQMAQLRTAIADDTEALQAYGRLTTLVQERIEYLNTGIALQRAHSQNKTLKLGASGEGKERMDEIRAVIAEMQAAEERKLTEQLNAEAAARYETRRVTIVMTLLAIAILSVLVFVTRRDAARIRASEQRLATTLRSIGDAVIATDRDGYVRELNPIAEQLTGWTAADATGKHLDDVLRMVNEDTRVAIESPVARVLRDGGIVGLANHTLLIRRDGNETAIEDSAAPILDADGETTGVVLVFRDATEIRAAERALLTADRRKDEFLAVLAHELRNPLAPIRHAVQIARSPRATADQVKWSQDVIERQSGHMARLLEDLLDVSRITRGSLDVRKSRVELREVVDAAIEMAAPLMQGRGHTLAVDLPRDAVWLDADPLRLAQVIGNLFTNAAKYTHPGGDIRLDVECDDRRIVLRVVDNGIGLTADSLTSIFQMFAQLRTPLDRTEGGLGIGLALAKGLVELHDGTIEARSEGPGRGSEFIVTLPRAADANGQPQPSSEAPKGADADGAAKLRVLVADDNEDAAESIALLLQLHGHAVERAHDGQRALDAICAAAPDLALLDIGMPRLNGYDVAQRVRSMPDGDRVTLVAITGWGQPGDRERARSAGFDHHWVKPVDSAALLDLCESIAKARATL
jgi:PAS domain S-box-containing protein